MLEHPLTQRALEIIRSKSVGAPQSHPFSVTINFHPDRLTSQGNYARRKAIVYVTGLVIARLPTIKYLSDISRCKCPSLVLERSRQRIDCFLLSLISRFSFLPSPVLLQSVCDGARLRTGNFMPPNPLLDIVGYFLFYLFVC